MPKKSIEKNRVVISSGQGTDGSSNDITIISGLDVSVTASDVISSNDLGGYLGNNVQINLDDLTSDAREGQPPKIGYEAITFSNGETTTTHEGRPDWGQAKIVDTPPWTAKQPRKKWTAQYEMPHYGVGKKTDKAPSDNLFPKYVNDSGAYDTINLNYRDNSDNSYYGLALYNDFPFLVDAPQFTQSNYPHIAQSVPRSAFQTNLQDNLRFPFLYQKPFIAEENNRDFFNTSDYKLGFNAGEGTSSLGVKNGQASISLSSPFSTELFDPRKSHEALDATDANSPPFDVGLIVSGLLFPADRGVLALIRFPSDDNNVAQGFNTPATTVDIIENRVLAAINLGVGAGVNDGASGGVIFNNSDNNTFPSRVTGQYDLYELHTGNYVPNSTRIGANGDLTADPSIGKVRLLTNIDAFYPSSGSSVRPGGIPVLFSPYEKHNTSISADTISFNSFYSESDPISDLKAYAIDDAGVYYDCTINTQGSQIEVNNPAGITDPTTFYAHVLKQNRSFLSYRLPALKDYSSEGITTPFAERDRFFVKNTPNEDEFKADYKSIFDTAGGYITFGEEDNYSYQVARYRQVVRLVQDYIKTLSQGESTTDDEPEYNFGSFALIHFKTEKAFESLVRDGIAPSDDEVYSRNLLDYSNLNNNLGSSLSTVGGDGLEDGVDSFTPSPSMSIFRPNVNFEKRLDGYPQDLVIKTKAQAWGLYPSVQANELRANDTYFMWTSGVIYVNPTTWRAYKGHPSDKGGASATHSTDTQHSRLQTIIEITQKSVQGDDHISEFDQVKPTISKPFHTVRPTAQILTSELSASDNLFAGKYERLSNNALTEYETIPKHQQVWVTTSGLGGNLAGNITVIPKGDAGEALDDLSLYNPKDGLCSFTTVGLRPSVMINKPHRQFNNLGVEYIKDNINDNSSSTIKKLLYHSARKISLLELYGEKLSPNGKLIKDESSISSINNIYTGIDLTKNRVGEDYRSNNNFAYGYIWADWENTNVGTQTYTPRSSGQAFSIYRYDVEGYKVYQELELLPIGGDVVNGYALELCTGWDWVKNSDDSDAGVGLSFKYSRYVPVYRPVEPNHTRTTLETHADAKFLVIKGVDYYVEMHPSIPYNWNTNTNPAVGGHDPTNFINYTEPKNSIGDLGGDATSDLSLIFSPSLTDKTTAATALTSLYDFMGTTTNNHGEYVGHGVSPIDAASANAIVNPTVGNTYHLAKLSLSSLAVFSITTNPQHPHPTTSVRVDTGGFVAGTREFGDVIVEAIPTGRRQLPEYGNYTMDIRGYITVSGMGNTSVFISDQLQAVSTISRLPLVSLFTPRKDTQERFLDESYRIEHSLAHLFFIQGNDPDFNYQFGNHQDTSGVTPITGNTELRDNLIGPGIPNFGSGYNGGYISFPVRDESNVSPEGWLANTTNLRLYSFHGFAGYLRNSLHMRRIQITSPLIFSDWLEAQVSGFPNMTRNHLSGAKYGTPPRGVLIYPYQDFDGNTISAFGYNLSNSGQATVNPLVDSESGFYLPNSNAGLSAYDDVANNIAGNYGNNGTWLDDDAGGVGVSTDPILRHAQPTYSGGGFVASNDSPDVGYLRAFDLNFGKSVERSPHLPYWDTDWTETTASGEEKDRLSTSATPKGLIESKEWERVKGDEFAPIKLRLVGVDWDMISYVDPQFPNARRDGTVYTIDNKQHLMRKRVMRVFVKVPGLTTWLDVGVMNGEVGESYVQYAGDPTGTFGVMSEGGATSDKTHPSLDGAGCCVSYKETFLVEEGLVALDLELDVGFVPAFMSVGDDTVSTDTIASSDNFLGQEKVIYVNNSDKFFSASKSDDLAYGKGGTEAPILVKVILGNPDFPKYEVHPENAFALVNRDDLADQTTLIANVYGGVGTNAIYDIWPSPNKSYRGHSFPPDDRAPTWSRRGLMGIEVLRPDGSNFDHDLVVDRPDFADLSLFGSLKATKSGTSEDDRSHYMVYRQVSHSASGYLRGDTALEGTIKTNKQTYTFDDDLLDEGVDYEEKYSLSKKGEG